MSEDYFALIMAGGGGTRLWPLSRRGRPKQQLSLVGETSLFRMTVDRLIATMSPERIIVATIDDQVEALQKQAPMLPDSSFLVEPSPRGTASVIGLGAMLLHQRHGDCVMACLPADHYMQNEERFRRSLLAAYQIAEKGHLVTLGIPPTHSATGYGYIHQGKSIGKFLEFEAFEVESFKEKPSFSQAEEFLASGKFAWNSGMFVWRTSSILEEIEMQMEELHAGLMEISGSFGKPDESVVLEKVWHRLKSQTIDYGIMEGARHVAMIAADGLGWFDIGGWDGLADARQKDDDGNLIIAEEAIAIDSKGIVLFQDADGASKRLIAVLGVKDLIIVDTGDAILVCSKDRAEEVRRVVENLEVEGKIQYL